jgi:hypothetical protein
MALTDKQRRFVDEYLIDLNATQAAIRAGYSAKNANKVGPEILGKTWFQRAIAERRKEMSSKTAITPEMVLKRWWDMANVDVNELVQYRRDNCRHCWGEEHEYQWTHGEFEQAQRDAEDEGKPDPSCAGGFGFVHNREPNPECPECGGEGRGKVHVQDTRRLTGAARVLYDGVHQGKDGLKVLLQDRGKALENVARHLGMFNDKRDDDGKVLAAEKLRIENDRLRKGLDDPDDTPPESKRFVIEVRDARKRDA